MAIISHTYDLIVGVDTHARNHVYALITNTGELLACDTFPATSPGHARALAWIRRRTPTHRTLLWVIEGIGTYGAGLARTAKAAGYDIAEAPRIDNRRTGKTDQLDAQQIARAVLPLDTTRLRRPRLDDGTRDALRTLIAARDQMTTERTANINALTALLRRADLGLDARHPLTRTQITTITAWRTRTEPTATSIARHEAIRLATRITTLTTDLAANTATMTTLVTASPAATLLNEPGIGVYTAAILYTTWSHPGRVHSEAAFANLCGTSPIPASSGNTTRHRLNRGGDRRANRALHIAILYKTAHDPQTRAYIQRRTTEGLTPRDIRRCLKRHLARRVYKALEHANPA